MGSRARPRTDAARRPRRRRGRGRSPRCRSRCAPSTPRRPSAPLASASARRRSRRSRHRARPCLLQHGPHPFGRLDRDDGLRQERQRKSVAPAARADVEPRLTRLHQRAQDVERGLVRPPRVRAKVGRDRGVEVARRRAFAKALGLLAIGAHPAAPGLERRSRPWDEAGRTCAAGRQRARLVKAGMTSAANQSSCSSIIDSGAPMGWLTDTRSSPGYSFSRRMSVSMI